MGKSLYYYRVKEIEEQVNALSSLAAVEELLCMSICFDYLTGNYNHEYWSVENKSVASISLSGGILKSFFLKMESNMRWYKWVLFCIVFFLGLDYII